MNSPTPRPRRCLSLRAGLLVVLTALLAWQCEFDRGNPLGNTPPDTRLANVPANDTIGTYILQGVIPEQTLYWAGDDPDGYVVAYQFRWIDFVVPRADTTSWRTVLNLTSIGTVTLDTLIEVKSTATSLFRIYNYFATIGASATQQFVAGLADSLAKGTWFAVPYPSGPVAGDSVRGADPVQIEAPTKANFIFGSTADSNQHRFEVRAVDNTDLIDQSAAFVHFWTLRSPGPIILDITGTSLSFPRFIIRCATERNPGITFGVVALDRSTLDRVYSWAVDDTTFDNWSEWSRDASFTATAAMLRETGSDTHRVYVRARNRWGVISSIYGESFRAVAPEIDTPGWPKRILVLMNNKLVSGTGFGGALDSTLTKAAYASLLDGAGMAGKYDFWVRVGGNPDRWPPRQLISRYTTVLFVADNSITPPRDGARWVVQSDKVDSLEEYLAYGGNIIWSGSPYVERWFAGGAWPAVATGIFHLSTAQGTYRINTGLDFAGVLGIAGYPDVAVDSSLVPADSGYAIRGIGTYQAVVTFGEKISQFRSASGNVIFDRQPVGVRYISAPADPGPFCRRMFSVVYLGYPLYFMRSADAVATLQKAFTDIGAY